MNLSYAKMLLLGRQNLMTQRRSPEDGQLLRETFQVDAVTLARIKALARREGLSRSAMECRLIRYGLDYQRKLDALAEAAG